VEQRRALDLARVSVANDWLTRDPTLGALILLEVADPENTRFAPRLLSEALSRALVSAEYRHAGPVHSVTINAAGSRVLTTSGKQATIWDVRTSRALRPLTSGETVIDGSFDPTDRFVVIRSGSIAEQGYFQDRGGGKAWVYEVESGRLRLVAEHGEEMTRALFSPNGRLLLTVGEDHTAQLWDVEAGQRMATPPLQHEGTIRDVSFSPDGQLLATVSGDVTQLWTVATGEVSGSPLTPNSESSTFSPDGRRLPAVSDTLIRLWDWRTGKPLKDLTHAKAVNHASFTPDGKLVVSASADGTARTWDVETGRKQFVARHENEVKDSLLVAGGTRLATLSGGKLRLWRVSTGTAAPGDVLIKWMTTTRISTTRSPRSRLARMAISSRPDPRRRFESGMFAGKASLGHCRTKDGTAPHRSSITASSS
jgi:WD40 repeat protein